MDEYLKVGIDHLSEKQVDELSQVINDWLTDHGLFEYIGVE